MAWFSSGRVTNPALGQVLLDTGELTGGAHIIAVAMGATGAGAVEVQQRNAANDATQVSQILAVPAMGFAMLPTEDASVDEAGRFRIVAVGAIIGIVSVSLWTAV